MMVPASLSADGKRVVAKVPVTRTDILTLALTLAIALTLTLTLTLILTLALALTLTLSRCPSRARTSCTRAT